MKRTGAAAAVASKYLARPESSIVTICGCGTQGRIRLQAMKTILPIEKAYAFDVDRVRAEVFAKQMSIEWGIQIVVTADLNTATKQSDVIVTCTPSRRYYLAKENVSAGTFIVAMGADSPEKQELEPELLRSNKVVVDLLEQCEHVGELHHAIKQGMAREDVYADLGEIVVGKKPGRTSKDEIIVFDATGTAIQDVPAAAVVYSKATRLGLGNTIDLFG